MHQTTLKTSYLFSPAVFWDTASQYACHRHRVFCILRNRAHPLTHPPVLASGGVECGDVHVHDLDGNLLPHPIRGLYRLERECHQLGAGVVRYRYVTRMFTRALSLTNLIQPFDFKSVFPSHCLLAVSASCAASILSPTPPL